jgi:hypothetical protein
MLNSRSLRRFRSLLVVASALLAALPAGFPAARGETIPVRHPQGFAHGFVEVVTLQGQRIAVGDLTLRLRGDVVTSRLVLRFLDGSVDDETTIYSQRVTYRFLSDHHIQRGPSFPTPLDATVDARKGLVIATAPDGRRTQVHLDMPPDLYNGMASSLLMNVLPSTPETKIAVVVPGTTPRIVHLSMKPAGERSFTMGGSARKATDYVVHVELGGVSGVVAPLIGKEPPDYHLWLLTGADPAFIREEGQLYQGGPVWRIQQVSAEFPAEKE